VWQLGAKVKWEAVCQNADRLLIPLPGYPFERQRFWADSLMQSRVPTATGSADERLPQESWYSVPAWRAVNPGVTSRTGIAAASPWLIVGCADQIEAVIATHLRASGAVVVRVEPGTRYERLAADRFSADASEPDHLRQILETLQYEGVRPRSIIHCGGLAAEPAEHEDEIFWRAQERGFLGLLSLLREMQKLYPISGLSVVALTSETSCVPTDRIIRPEHATLIALGAVLVQEVPGCKLTIVDLAGVPREDIEGRSDLSEVYADWIAGEAVGGCREPLVAYRLGQRLVREFARLPLASGGPPRGIKKDGVYVISGGLGRVGLALAEHLTGSYRARLVLITRKVLPAEPHWESTLADPSCPSELADCLRRLTAIRRQTTDLLVACADLSDAAAVRDVLDAAERRFGRLNGVFHLAADLAHASAQRPLEKLTRADLQVQCRAKVQGLHCLRRVLEDKPMDFAVVFSSNSAILGGAGLAAYAAANAYVSAAVIKESTRQPQRWRAFSWDGLVDDADLSSASAHICLRDALRVSCQLLDRSVDPLIVVSALDLATRLQLLREPTASRQVVEAPASTREQRPRMATAYVAARSDMERLLVEVWEETLAIAGIGVEDDLFDLNGDSLNAMSILSRVDELFGVEVPLRKFMSGKTTIARLGSEISTRLESRGAQSRLSHERALAGRV
jgi:NAD(P)-dependent dehydrogenase (short-subunit alcohol dehydrogenase family)/acyl carrier protein